MVRTDNDDYVVVTQINVNKQPLANSDLALYISYLSKGFHLDQNDVIRVMEAFKTEFRYELSKEAVSEDEEEDWDPGNHTNNMFTRRGDRSLSNTPSMASGSSRATSTASTNSANSGRSNSSIGHFPPPTVKQMNQTLQVNLRDFLRKARNGLLPQGTTQGNRSPNNPKGWIIACQEPVFITTN